MTAAELRRSATDAPAVPPAGLRPALLALWHDARGDWALAHQAAQEDLNPEGYWVHAYLHRKEGDASNARYWYSKAGRPVPVASLASEWTEIAGTLL